MRHSTKVKYVCPICGQDFLYKKSEVRKYCSRKCYLIARNILVTRNCPICSVEFVVKKHSSSQKYCSYKCFETAVEIAVRKPILNVNCLRCGKSFETMKTDLHQYCSTECRYPTPYKECPICNNLFLKNALQKYCSDECLRVGTRGKNHHLWRGGGRTYRGPNWLAQRKLARQRDGGICQICHRKPRKGAKRYDIHHIKPFRACRDYLEANQLTNLITLCKACHVKAEHNKIPVPIPLL